MTKILITVKTYPHPSTNHKELVCTAGITENNEWIRLYPIDFRYLDISKQFKKYQWIDVDIKPRSNDKRIESREPILSSMKVLGQPIDTKNRWAERNKIINKLPVYTVNELKDLYKIEYRSLGIVKPSEVIDVKVTPTERNWKPKWENLLNQLSLFDAPRKPLSKIPYKFQYVFRCHDSANIHRAQITDWELGVLFLNEVKRLGSEDAAIKSVKKKYLEEMCSDKKDVKFFMGTTYPFNSWIVLGVYWPPA